MLHNNSHSTLNRSKIFLDYFQSFSTDLLAGRTICQQFAQSFFQFCCVLHLYGSAFCNKTSDNFSEVLHVRSKDHCFAQSSRLDGILTSFGQQTFANEYHRSVLVKMLYLAGAVHDETLNFSRLILLLKTDFASIDKLHSSRAQLAANFFASLKMTGHQHQK